MKTRTLIILLIMLIAVIGVWYFTRGGIPTLPATATSTARTDATTATTSAASSTPITDQYEIRAQDSGKTFQYPLTSRFTIILDSTKYRPGDIRCQPAGTLGPISNIPAVQKPYFAVRFETVAPGSCTISAGAFHVTIVATQ